MDVGGLCAATNACAINLRVSFMLVKQRIVRVGSCPAVVAQWQSVGGSSQRCPGFDSRRLPAFHFPPFSPQNNYIDLCGRAEYSGIPL